MHISVINELMNDNLTLCQCLRKLEYNLKREQI